MQGISAKTTVIMRRFRSSASRTWVFPFVTSPGVKRSVSCASHSGYVHIGLFENEANQYADYVLPVASGIEKGGISRASEERRIVWNDKLIEPPGEARADGRRKR